MNNDDEDDFDSVSDDEDEMGEDHNMKDERIKPETNGGGFSDTMQNQQ